MTLEAIKDLFLELTLLGRMQMPADRIAFVKKTGFKGYLMVYQPDKLRDLARLHYEIIDSIEHLTDFIGILGFRGCGKSTLVEDYASYAMLLKVSRYTLYIGSTDDKARSAVMNIKSLIENTPLIVQDFKIQVDKQRDAINTKWTEGQITVDGHTIQAKSRGAKVRGSKFQDYRPTLIIGDDLEDTENTRSNEIRRKTREWFFTELLPCMTQDKEAKIILIGNLVHRDCILSHLDNQKLENGNIIHILKFAIRKEDGSPSWKGLYPDEEAIQKQKQKILLSGEGLGQVIWAREYELKLVDEDDQVLKLSDIQRYPDEWLQKKPVASGVGVDFAISEKTTADYTAMVKGIDVNNENGERRLLIMKNNVEKRMNFEETIRTAVEINEIMPNGNKFYPEKISYQQAAIEIMQKNGITCVPMINTSDKRSRIVSACYYIKTGRVLFPETGAENLINNLIGFGVEDHDDIADAFANLVLGMVKKTGGILLG